MGYSHYYPHTEVTKEVWEKILVDCRKLHKNMPDFSTSAGNYYTEPKLQLGNWMGNRVLVRLGNMDEIVFNGFPKPFDHESFKLRRLGSNGFTFCKTARKPYDLMVCACLIVYHYHSSETIEIDSDGDLDDWKPALDFVEEVLGAAYSMKFMMEVEHL